MNQINENRNEQLIDVQTIESNPKELIEENGFKNDNIVIDSNNDIDIQDGLQDEQTNKLIELEQKALELENKEKSLNSRQLRMDTMDILYNKNLPIDMIDFIIGDDIESTKTKIEKFEAMFNKAVQRCIEQKLKGKAPFIGNVLDSSNNYKSKVRNILGS